jgi:hypothetical protein
MNKPRFAGDIRYYSGEERKNQHEKVAKCDTL